MEGRAALVELVFVFLVVMGVSVWQLVSVRRSLARDRERAREAQAREQAESGAREGSPPPSPR